MVIVKSDVLNSKLPANIFLLCQLVFKQERPENGAFLFTLINKSLLLA